MKLTIVSPQFPFSGRVPLVPPILEYLAALTLREAPHTDIQLIDANQTPVEVSNLTGDLVAISAMTATAPWAYRFADECRRSGRKVVMGGIHPTALPEEAALHADAVVSGEAESAWGDVLRDFRAGALKNHYQGVRLPLDNLPTPIDAKLKGNYRFRAFFTMRGCPYRCTFCSVRTFFGDTIRYRPITEVITEIEQCAGKVWFNGDDNIWGGDSARSITLFEELARGTRRNWYGFGDLKAVQGKEGERMLTAARKSGLFSVWVGWESESTGNLDLMKAGGKQGGDRIRAIRMMRDAGIDVVLFVVLGGRHDSLDSFARTLELSEKLGVGIHPVLLTPLPGTELFAEYREHLLPGLGWERFTGVNAVFDHPDPIMTPQRREEEYHRLSTELLSARRILGRVSRLPMAGFPMTHMLSLMKQMPMKRAIDKAYDEWREGQEIVEAAPGVRAPGFGSGFLPDLAMGYLSSCLAALAFTEYFLETRHGSRDAALSVIDNLELFLFWNILAVLLVVATVGKERIFQHLDTLFKTLLPGVRQKLLMVKYSVFYSSLSATSFWAWNCVFD